MFYDKLGRRLGAAAVGHPWKTLVGSLLLFAVVALGFTRLGFSTDYRIFFSKDDPGLDAFNRLEQVFTKTDNVLFVVKANEGSVFDPEVLEVVQELTEAGWKVPYASRVDSLTNFQHARATEDDIAYGPLVAKPARSLSPDELAAARASAVDEPLLRGSLLSKDLTTTGIHVTLRLPTEKPEAVTEAAESARRVASGLGAKHPRLDVRVSGMACMNDAFMQASMRDMAVLMPIMVVVLLVSMALLLRSVISMIPVATMLLLSAAMTTAIAGWLGYPLTPPTVAAPLMVLTVAVADGVHIVLSVRENLLTGQTRDEAIVAAIAQNLEAITYTALTTVVGFVCLNFSESPPVGHLANMTSFGVAVALLYSVTLLPALLMLLPIAARPASASAGDGWIGWLADFSLRRRGVLVAGFVGITIGAGVLTARLELNDEFVQYFDRSVPFRRDVDFTLKNLSGIYRLEFQVGSGAPSGIADPHYLERLDAFAGWLRAQPEVQHVYSIADIIKRVNRVVHDDDPAAYRIPESREAASQFLLLYEMGLPAGLDLTDRVNVDKSAARLTVTVTDISSRHMTELDQRSRAWLRENTPPPMWSEASGPVVIFSRLSDRNARAMIKGDLASLILISLCMVLVLRSLKLGIASVIPNVIPIVVGYGLWKLFVGQINVVATVAGSVSLGIIVDDTIHFLSKYQQLRRKTGMGCEEAVRATLLHVAPAMLSTGLILVLGFGVLTLSSFQMTSHLGWLTVLIVGIAPLVDLLLMPALVLLVHARDKRASLSFETQPAETGAL